jgi:flagellar motility protein MotE (MotC chaperone)
MTDAVMVDPGGDEELDKVMGGGPETQKSLSDGMDAVEELLAVLEHTRQEMEDLLDEMEELDPATDVTQRSLQGRVAETGMQKAA